MRSMDNSFWCPLHTETHFALSFTVDKKYDFITSSGTYFWYP